MKGLEESYKLKTKEAIDTAQKYHRLLTKRKEKVIVMYCFIKAFKIEIVPKFD